jgi:hypothetical protein
VRGGGGSNSGKTDLFEKISNIQTYIQQHSRSGHRGRVG